MLKSTTRSVHNFFNQFEDFRHDDPLFLSEHHGLQHAKGRYYEVCQLWKMR